MHNGSKKETSTSSIPSAAVATHDTLAKKRTELESHSLAPQISTNTQQIATQNPVNTIESHAIISPHTTSATISSNRAHSQQDNGKKQPSYPQTSKQSFWTRNPRQPQHASKAISKQTQNTPQHHASFTQSKKLFETLIKQEAIYNLLENQGLLGFEQFTQHTRELIQLDEQMANALQNLEISVLRLLVNNHWIDLNTLLMASPEQCDYFASFITALKTKREENEIVQAILTRYNIKGILTLMEYTYDEKPTTPSLTIEQVIKALQAFMHVLDTPLLCEALLDKRIDIQTALKQTATSSLAFPRSSLRFAILNKQEAIYTFLKARGLLDFEGLKLHIGELIQSDDRIENALQNLEVSLFRQLVDNNWLDLNALLMANPEQRTYFASFNTELKAKWHANETIQAIFAHYKLKNILTLMEYVYDDNSSAQLLTIAHIMETLQAFMHVFNKPQYCEALLNEELNLKDVLRQAWGNLNQTHDEPALPESTHTEKPDEACNENKVVLQTAHAHSEHNTPGKCISMTKDDNTNNRVAELIDILQKNPEKLPTLTGTDLLDAIKNKQFEFAKLLLHIGVNPNVTDDYGETPLAKVINDSTLIPLLAPLILKGGDLGNTVYRVGDNLKELSDFIDEPKNKTALEKLQRSVRSVRKRYELSQPQAYERLWLREERKLIHPNAYDHQAANEKHFGLKM